MQRPYFNLTDFEVNNRVEILYQQLEERNLSAHDILRVADQLAQAVYLRHPEVVSDRSGYWKVTDHHQDHIPTHSLPTDHIGKIVLMRFDVGDRNDLFPGWVCGHDPLNNTYQVKYKSKVVNEKGEYYAFEQHEDCSPMCVSIGMLRARREGYPPSIDCRNSTVAPAIYKTLNL